MKRSTIFTAVSGALLALSTGAFAQVVPGPQDDSALSWGPSQWGKDDRAGSANYTKDPAIVARALAQIKQNKAITIGKYYHREAPAFGPRSWSMYIPGTMRAVRNLRRSPITTTCMKSGSAFRSDSR